MGVEHQVAKMTAHGVQITGEGFGGTGELSQTDIAAALAGLHGQAYWLMRLKYCADMSMFQRLSDSIAFRLLGQALAGGDDIGARAAGKVASVVVMQFTTGPVCDSCHGTGTAFHGATVKDCGACNGSGRLSMTQETSAGIAGVSVPTYRKKYARMVNAEVSRLESIESNAFSHIRRRIYGEKTS
tara:strand:- start:4000 stop:4554 length:555 start_codon:yes stop_codon:yes gene_type:complete